ncbi:hypothetical protein P9199_14440 [Geobacillus stearothermophilus]|uniref:hypothetical protein n=1 Tax=Geobacillus stearothermophilus TaxID=1422 RepID=UPI002E200C19|nr:hypothetical protein [Geobacillus stearothermophilus]
MRRVKYNLKNIGLVFYPFAFTNLSLILLEIIGNLRAENILLLSQVIYTFFAATISVSLLSSLFEQKISEGILFYYPKEFYLNFFSVFMMIFINISLLSISLGGDWESYVLHGIILLSQVLATSSFCICLALWFRNTRYSVIVFIIISTGELLTFGKLIPMYELYYLSDSFQAGQVLSFTLINILIAVVLNSFIYSTLSEPEYLLKSN